MKDPKPNEVKVFTRKDTSKRLYLTYGDTHGTNPFTGLMSPLGPIPPGVSENEISQEVEYERSEVVTADIYGHAALRGDVFTFEGRKYLVEESNVELQRDWKISHVVATWRESLLTQ